MEDLTDLKKYLKKLQRVISNDADFTFFGSSYIKKNKVDDIWCCILASIPNINKKNMNTDLGKKLNSVIAYKHLFDALKKKYPDKEYQRLKGGEILKEDTSFSKYSFIANNSIYIFNPQKLDNGKFEYKKVYNIANSIKVMNITPNSGADIRFYDYNDTIYTLHDDNTNNKVKDSYDMYLNANYNLSDYLKWDYSTEFLGKKIDYDFMSEYAYVKDNRLLPGQSKGRRRNRYFYKGCARCIR